MNIETKHQQLPTHIKTEISDQIQFFLRKNADQQMRFVIGFSKMIDFEVLKKAIRLSIFAEPVFSCVYYEEFKKPYWEKQEFIDTSLLIEISEGNQQIENEISKFLQQTISPFEFPLVKAKLFRDNGKDILCFNMNHTPTDGAGLKQFVKKLATIYNSLLKNPDFIPACNLEGDRSLKQVTTSFSLSDKLQFAKYGFKKPKRNPSWSFGWDANKNENKKQIIIDKIPENTFLTLKEYGKQHNATVNDIVISAFMRSFEKSKPGNKLLAKPVIIPVDLRKYVNPEHHSAICSLTGSMICNIGNETGNSFSETLLKVKNEIKVKKEKHAEMFMLTQFLILSKIVPYAKLKNITMQRKMPPIPLVTNIGVINPDDINFNGIPVEYSYLTGAICTENFFCLGFSTFKNEITFSVGFTGGNNEIQKVKKFLNDLKVELELINLA